MINISYTKKQADRYREMAKDAKDLGVRAVFNKKARDFEQMIKDEQNRQTAINTAELFAKYAEPVEAPKRGRKPKAETVQTEVTE